MPRLILLSAEEQGTRSEHIRIYFNNNRVGWGMEPRGVTSPLIFYLQFYVFEICILWKNTMLPPIDYCDGKTDAGKKRGK